MRVFVHRSALRTVILLIALSVLVLSPAFLRAKLLDDGKIAFLMRMGSTQDGTPLD